MRVFLGIIAARIKDKYNKPTIIISFQDDIGKHLVDQ